MASMTSVGEITLLLREVEAGRERLAIRQAKLPSEHPDLTVTRRALASLRR